MITLFRSQKTLKLDELKRTLSQQLSQLPHMITPMGDNLRILRYEYPVEPLDILTWLHNQKTPQKIYWSNRHHGWEMGGVGIADLIESKSTIDYQEVFEYIEDHLEFDNPHLRYYGGFAFREGTPEKSWERFGAYRFCIPQFEILKTSQETIFAFNIAIKDINEDNLKAIFNAFQSMDFSKNTSYRKVPAVQSRVDEPSQQKWIDLLNKIVGIPSSIEKIVLARKSSFDFDMAIRPSALIKHLKDQTPGCFHFCFQVDEHNAFLGASPERLYKINEKFIESEALAGTVPRGKTKEEDIELAENLAKNPKTIAEHQYVVQAIHDVFKNICSSFEYDNHIRVLKLKDGQHLLSHFRGVLKDKAGQKQILSLLHPTPAVAGTPQKESLKAIKTLEPFNRGWYAGPVGYIGYDEAEFAVAIRSGLVDNNQLSIYAGAGIVKGSQPQAEWEEVEGKISRFMKVFEQ